MEGSLIDVKFVAISRIEDGVLLLNVPHPSTKKAYIEEV